MIVAISIIVCAVFFILLELWIIIKELFRGIKALKEENKAKDTRIWELERHNKTLIMIPNTKWEQEKHNIRSLKS